MFVFLNDPEAIELLPSQEFAHAVGFQLSPVSLGRRALLSRMAEAVLLRPEEAFLLLVFVKYLGR